MSNVYELMQEAKDMLSRLSIFLLSDNNADCRQDCDMLYGHNDHSVTVGEVRAAKMIVSKLENALAKLRDPAENRINAK
jgi:hypothetical protein